MRTKIVRIGNSQGVRIPKEVLADAGLLDDTGTPVEADMSITNEGVLIRPAGELGPAEAFLDFAQRFREETGGIDLTDYGPLRDIADRPIPFLFDEEDEETDDDEVSHDA